MLFNSYIFIFVFLPIVLIGFFAIGRLGHHRVAIAWLVGASLFFYGWWNPAYLELILGSILFNYAIGAVLGSNENLSKKLLLIMGVSGNLILLGYFKYANFFVDNLNLVTGVDINLETIILPLAISFFTFQQITYLVDAYRGETREYHFLHYCLFVTFFPQLIAGPIVHHREMLPQFARDVLYRLNYEHLAVGITIFAIGLFKKVVLADGIAIYASPVFSAAEEGVMLTLFEAWFGALAYTFQLYFDFSGYSDMAIGIARMFGIFLPLNFHSPYKANNIIEFWRRWHITLSRFLRDYLYIPLGGNRKGKGRRHINLMTTMLLGGLWHGAGWTFIIWGGLHGLYLIINHSWHALRRCVGYNPVSSWLTKGMSRVITFVAIVVGWVFFRATTVDGAENMLTAMFGGHGISLPSALLLPLQSTQPWLAAHGVVFNGMFHNGIADFYSGKEMLVLLLIMVWFAPNTQQMLINFRPTFDTYQGEVRPWQYSFVQWKPSVLWAALTLLLLASSILLLSNYSEFLYFQF